MILEAEGAGGVYGCAEEGFGGGKAEQGACHIEGNQEVCGWAGAGVAISADGHRDAVVSEGLDRGELGFAEIIKGSG